LNLVFPYKYVIANCGNHGSILVNIAFILPIPGITKKFLIPSLTHIYEITYPILLLANGVLTCYKKEAGAIAIKFLILLLIYYDYYDANAKNYNQP